MDIVLSKNGLKCVVFKISDVQILFNIISTIYGSNMTEGTFVNPKGSRVILDSKTRQFLLLNIMTSIFFYYYFLPKKVIREPPK